MRGSCAEWALKANFVSVEGVCWCVANLMYFGVLAVGIVGALIARFRPRGMARALFATALAQTSVAVIALIAGLGYPWSGPLELSALNGFFVALFVASAWLFRRAEHARPERGAV